MGPNPPVKESWGAQLWRLPGGVAVQELGLSRPWDVDWGFKASGLEASLELGMQGPVVGLRVHCVKGRLLESKQRSTTFWLVQGLHPPTMTTRDEQIVPLKLIEYDFGYIVIRPSIYLIFYLLKGDSSHI